MLKKLFLRYGLAATAGVALAVMGPAVQVDLSHDENEAHATTALEVDSSALPKALADDVQIQAWPVPTRRSYYITASCSQHAAAIRRGAAAWQGLTEGGGTPVECRNSYITDCGGGGRIVGCNWGRGQRIALYMGGVGDDALLAAHEFGHDWYGHSTYRCAGWGSPQEVMAPSICTLRGSPDARQ